MFRNAIASSSRLPSPLRSFCTCNIRTAGIPKSRNRNPNTTATFLRQAKPLNPHYPKTELHIGLKDTTAITARPVLINEESCREIVKAWGIDKMEEVTIIEAYAGSSSGEKEMRRKLMI